ncbi:MAG: zinc ribbon domain-containing protein [Actinomycetota bacterium]
MAVPADVFDPDAAVLLGSRCGACGSVHFPPLAGCPECFAPEAERVPLSRTGHVRSYTAVNLGFPGYPERYLLAEVVLPEGVVVVGQLAGLDDEPSVAIGLPVQVESGPIRVDAHNEPVHGYRFVPAAPEVRLED